MRVKRKYFRISTAVFAFILLCGCSAEKIPEAEPTTVHVMEEQYAPTAPFSQEPTYITPMETVSMPTDMLQEESISKDPWYLAGRLIYHACGGIDGVSYTNSKEAMESTLGAGNMLVEVDFLYTTDGHLICLHKWIDMLPVWKYKELKREYKGKEDQIPETEYTLDQFLSKKVKGKFTGLTAADIVFYMKENPELHIVVDTKEENLSMVVGDLLRLCAYQPDIADRFIIQLYDRGQKEKIQDLYPFHNENFLFTCYKFGPARVQEILEICDTEQISVVTVASESWDLDTITLFTDKGITLFEHTVNLPETAEMSLKNGIYGFYTDFLQESELMKLTY